MKRSGAWLAVGLLLPGGTVRISGARAPAEHGPIHLDLLFVGAHPRERRRSRRGARAGAAAGGRGATRLVSFFAAEGGIQALQDVVR